MYIFLCGILPKFVGNKNPYSIFNKSVILKSTYNVGPHILSNRLNSQDYLDFLRKILLENVPLAVRFNIWFLQDGAPPHYANVVRRWLNRHFLDLHGRRI